MPTRKPIQSLIDSSVVETKRLAELWNTVIRDLLNNGNPITVDVDPVICRRYRYDFYGLLVTLNIDKRFHYPIMLGNGMTNPTQYNGDVYTIKKFDITLLNKYYNAFNK